MCAGVRANSLPSSLTGVCTSLALVRNLLAKILTGSEAMNSDSSAPTFRGCSKQPPAAYIVPLTACSTQRRSLA